jgi:peptide/nickel transport system permease protein
LPFTRLLINRIFLTIVVIWGVTTVCFLIMNVLPRDTAAAMCGPNATPEQLAKFRHDWGLDRPMIEQYLRFYAHILRGDIGVSIRTQRSVIQEMIDFFPATFELGIFGLALGLLMGIPFGIFSALHRGKWFDHFVRVFSVSGVSIPNFWLGLLLLFLLYFKARIFLPGHLSLDITIPRVTGLILIDSLIAGNLRAFVDGLRHIAMPAFAVALSLTGYISRQVRTSMIEVLGSEYIRAAKSRGLAFKDILFRHALKNALIPTVSILGVLVGRLFSGAIVAEIIFAWPGMGYNAYLSILKADQPMILGFTFFVAIIYSAVTFIVDLLYGYLNPKIRQVMR